MSTNSPDEALEILETDAQRHGYDLWSEMESKFRSEDIELLRALASRAGVDTDGSREELATRLAEAHVFLGPIGNDRYYHETENGVQVLGDQRLSGQETTPMGARRSRGGNHV